MKTNRIILAVCLVAAFACLFSCAKKEEGTTINATMNPLILDDDDANAKMYIDFADGNYQRWNAFDKVVVYNLDFADGNNSVTSVFTAGAEAEGAMTTQFHGPAVGEMKDGYFFFYPFSMAGHEQLDADNREYFTIPGTQYYTVVRNHENSETTTIDPSSFAMACNGEDLNFTMQNIFGAARLYLYTGGTGGAVKYVHHIEIEDQRWDLVGDLSMKLPEVDAARLATMAEDLYNNTDASNAHFAQELADYVFGPLGYQPNGISNTMTLDCHNYTFEGTTHEGAQVSTNGANRTSFIFGLRPGALTDGFTIRIYFTDHTMVTLHDWETETYTDPNNPTYDQGGYIRDGKKAFTIRPGRIKAIKPHVLDTYTDWAEW